MWKSLSIAKKVYFSLSILIVGYLASTGIGFVNGQLTELRLIRVSETLFQASRQSQKALTTFKEQIKLYNDAIIMGETSLLNTAQTKGDEVQEAFKSIVELAKLDAYTIDKVKDIGARLKAFNESAGKVYTAMSTDSEESAEGNNIGNRATLLAEQTKDFIVELTAFAQTFADDLKVELSNIRDASHHQRYLNLFLFIGVVVCAVVLVSIIVIRSISLPLQNTVNMIKDIAEGEGDLTARLEINSKDEVGELANWFNIFVEKIQQMIQDIASNAGTLNSSASDLSSISNQMTAGADDMSAKSDSVTSAAGEMSSNMNAVAAATEQASTNVNMVAMATEEMTGTVNEIAQNSEKARAITGEAVSQAKDASDRVDELGRAAQDIGKVTETITEISEQTNLLALNATIEAARAGEAGKGFAVVANEIKELARQTAEATGEIKSKIEGIQGTTDGTVKQIEEISKVINDVNDIVSTIATAVEEQSVTSKEIANNVVQASQGIAEVTENVTQSSRVSGEIAKDISGVNQASNEISSSSAQVNMSAEELRKLAEKLNQMVGKFKV